MEKKRQIEAIGKRHDHRFSLIRKTMSKLNKQNDNFLNDMQSFRFDRKSQSRQGSQAMRALNAKPGISTPGGIYS